MNIKHVRKSDTAVHVPKTRTEAEELAEAGMADESDLSGRAELLRVKLKYALIDIIAKELRIAVTIVNESCYDMTEFHLVSGDRRWNLRSATMNWIDPEDGFGDVFRDQNRFGMTDVQVQLLRGVWGDYRDTVLVSPK